MEELIRITDTITILRDGEVVGEVVSANTSPEEVKAHDGRNAKYPASITD